MHRNAVLLSLGRQRIGGGWLVPKLSANICRLRSAHSLRRCRRLRTRNHIFVNRNEMLMRWLHLVFCFLCITMKRQRRRDRDN